MYLLVTFYFNIASVNSFCVCLCIVFNQILFSYCELSKTRAKNGKNRILDEVTPVATRECDP